MKSAWLQLGELFTSGEGHTLHRRVYIMPRGAVVRFLLYFYTFFAISVIENKTESTCIL